MSNLQKKFNFFDNRQKFIGPFIPYLNISTYLYSQQCHLHPKIQIGIAPK